MFPVATVTVTTCKETNDRTGKWPHNQSEASYHGASSELVIIGQKSFERNKEAIKHEQGLLRLLQMCILGILFSDYPS